MHLASMQECRVTQQVLDLGCDDLYLGCFGVSIIPPVYKVKRFCETPAHGQTRADVRNHHHYDPILRAVQ